MESTQPILRCRYGYDPLDRLISQLQPDAPAHQRFYCKSRLATEIQGAIGFSVFQNNDLLLAQRKNQGGAVESTLLATDLQRSVLHTLTADQQQHPIAYSPYGHCQAESGLTSLLGFNGERPDPVTGYYLLGNGYRAFNPVLMRFNCPDSLSPFDKGGLNPYTYCLGDPTNNSDPTGNIILPSRLKFFASVWIDKTLDSISTSFARSINSTKAIHPTPVKSSILPTSLTADTYNPLKTQANEVPSLTDLTLNSLTHKKSRPILNQTSPEIRKRIDQLDNSKGQKIAEMLSKQEPSNNILKLAATGQLVGGADWAENLLIQSKNFSDVMRELRIHSNLDYSPASSFHSLKRWKFDIARSLINRQNHLNLIGR